MTSPPDAGIEKWIYQCVKGKTFIDIGGIGVDASNERTSYAAQAGALACTMADIRPFGFWEWDVFRARTAEKGVYGVTEFENIDVRKRETLDKLGRYDVVHSTGIFYHLPSPAEALWNLRSITSEYLITNTVCIPEKIENEFGKIELSPSGILFGAALTASERAVLNKYYGDKMSLSIDYVVPSLDEREPDYPWVQDGELTCWPYWYFYTAHAFRALLRLCRFEVVEEAWYQDHAMFVLCKPID